MPGSKSVLFTNGDYLDKSTIYKLVDMRISEIRVTLYPAFKELEHKPNLKIIYDFISSRDIHKYNGISQCTRRGLEVHFDIGYTHVFVISPNIDMFNNRAGFLKNENFAYVRTKPCFSPSYSAAIDYCGNLKLCCHIYDVQACKLSIGSIANSSFVNLWYGTNMNRYRRLLAKNDYSNLPNCRICNYHMPHDQEDEAKKNYLYLTSRM